MLLRPLLPAVIALAGGVLTEALLLLPLRAAPSLQALEDALNNPAPAALAAVLEPGEGLDPSALERRRSALRQRFPDARWRVQAGPTLRDGRSTTEVQVTGSRSGDPGPLRLEAHQQLVLSGSGPRFNRQEVIRESTIVRSGDADLKVNLLIPDAVLTGQRYDLDVVFDAPLEGAVVAGAIKPVTAAELEAFATPDLPLEALGGGGLFKTVQAPYQPGRQTWAVLLVHPRGLVAASKQVRVVADRQALQP
ncbi:MAG: hypothetical protein ACKO0M_02835 [Cyanobium sp.]